jgi:putative nucleotidyltransferase with HDIG domain
MNRETKNPETPARPRWWRRLRELPLHKQQWLAAAAVALVGLTLVPWPRVSAPDYQLGMIQPTTVIAEFDFPILKEAGELAREQEERAQAVPAAVFRVDSASAAAYSRLAVLRDQVRALRLRPGANRAGHGAPDRMSIPLGQETLIALLVQPDPEAILSEAAALLHDVMQRGFVSPELATQLADYRQVRIRDPLGDAIVPMDQVLTTDRVRELARARAISRGCDPEALAEVSLYCAVPNLVFDSGSTGDLVEKAKASVEPATGLVLKGEKIIGAHERITADRLRVLRSYENRRWERGVRTTLSSVILPPLGRLLVLFLTLGVFIVYLKLIRPDLLESPPDFWLLASIEGIVILLGAAFVRWLELPATLVPVSAVSILITLLFDERLALAACILPVVLIGMVADGGTLFMAVVGVGAVTTVLLTHAVRRRSQFFRHLALLPLVHLAMLGALALAEVGPTTGLAREAVAVAANPFLAAALALFMLPYAESVFGRCTDITLREYQDLNRPLLRKLMMAAPGTYHHSILVGTLAETAALEVGANPLLARIIGYYHDIGKAAKPDYFPENLGLGMKNPHDRLTPSMSRLIMESHIREGLALAREDRLPREVIQGIREHHGNSVMVQAWRKARRQDPQARLEEYSYPGPRPSTPESALVLLTDQLESAARTLENPTPSRIKGLVSRVLQENQESGNLDECGLSLRDLARVRDVLLPMLAAAFRSRIHGERGGDDAGARETSTPRAPLPRAPR